MILHLEAALLIQCVVTDIKNLERNVMMEILLVLMSVPLIAVDMSHVLPQLATRG